MKPVRDKYRAQLINDYGVEEEELAKIDQFTKE